MSREERRYPRIGPVLVRADCRVREKAWEGFLTSLSEGGAYLVTDEQLQVGENLSMEFLLPWRLGRIEVEANVVYAVSESDAKPEGYPAGVGIAFVAPSAEQLEQLRRYVSTFRQLAAELVHSERKTFQRG